MEFKMEFLGLNHGCIKVKSLFGGISLLGLVVFLGEINVEAQTVSNSSNIVSSSTRGTGAIAPSNATTTQLEPIIISGVAPSNTNQDTSLQQVDLSLGTSTFTLNQSEINTMMQGQSTSFNNILVHTPGVSQDTYGAIHFRNEDPYYRTYINGTLLPIGISGFGQDVDAHFVDSVTTKIGALPAMYPEGNYGILDVKTKTGSDLNGGDVSYYGGGNDMFNPSFSYGGTSKGTDFYFTGSELHDDLGLENPTSGSYALHDDTNQYKGFTYFSHQIPDSGRWTFMLSGDFSSYQIPNTPGQTTSIVFDNPPAVTPDSTDLDERQYEQTYYTLTSYQQTIDDFSFQLSQVNRYSKVQFNPDVNGDLYFNGVAASVNQDILTNGLQLDTTYNLGDAHKLGAGFLVNTSEAKSLSSTDVYTLDAMGNANNLETIDDNHAIRAYDYALYVQDEWKATEKLTVNYGLRFEQVKAYTNESAPSPRFNWVYQWDKDTAIHGGYAHYFDEPDLRTVAPTSVSAFDNTTNAADQDTDDAVRVEQSHYFDTGVTRTILPGLECGLDAYYKIAKNQLDDGQFGAANISSPYNYANATLYGSEFSVNYKHEGFSTYGNFAVGDSWAKNIVSSQFEFDSATLAYIGTNNVHLDQTQYYTASWGAAYTISDTTLHIDALYEDGIRNGFANQSKLDPYYPVSLGVEHEFKNLWVFDDIKIRADAVNIFDQVYIVNDGTGIGEGAVKYGERRSFFAGVEVDF